MKKIIYIVTMILVLMFVLIYVNNHSLKPRLELIISKGAGIGDFYIEDNNVYILGGITVKNNTEDEVRYSLSANSKADFKSGLIKSETLKVYNEMLSSDIFSIRGKEEQTIKVVIVGEYAGYPKKNDRLMPEITIHEKE